VVTDTVDMPSPRLPGRTCLRWLIRPEGLGQGYDNAELVEVRRRPVCRREFLVGNHSHV
jgi:hypothetical protein